MVFGLRYERARNAAVLLGIGLGGSLDGLVLHQPGGWFPVAAWVVTALGVALLWSTVRGAGRLPSTRSFYGYLLVAWGGFNLVEGIVGHRVFEMARIPLFDWLFILAGGIGFILAGLALRDGLGRPAPLSERRSGLDRRAY